MRLLFIFILFLSLNYAYAQQKPNWQDGVIVLRDGSIIESEIAFNPVLIEGLVLIKTEDAVKNFTPLYVDYFLLQNTDGAGNTKFYSLPIELKNQGITRYFFFEVCYESSSIALLKRDFQPLDFSKPKIKPVKRVVQKWFLIDPANGELRLIRDDKKIDRKTLFSSFNKYEDEMRDYISENRLKLTETEELIQALQYFTSLKEKE
ncbi:hypothetical protein GCM10009122_11940 [Fulvivirga kasyanovii]|uniref:DUF4468 domain-containing protein n=1 Tax=Fulvivirga kasyanovii TaxID=396812 RepID=A0ABW9RPR7_9BACT|nr:hypothetical protein [Fulvivirga kasyanovii]MTI26139.1 hypothetical protein [Fulvivirga kasyanovii]